MPYLEFTLLALACYRLARLIAVDEGPAGMFLKLRLRLGAYNYGPDGEPVSNLGRGISCVHCVGLWVALPLAIYAVRLEWYTVIYWLAIAGGASVLWSVRNDS